MFAPFHISDLDIHHAKLAEDIYLPPDYP